MEKENIKNDYILIIAAILLLILSVGVIFWVSSNRRNNDISRPSTPKIIGKAVLTINFGDNKKRSFEGEIISNETLIGVLIQASRAGNFSYKFDEKNNLAAVENFVKNGEKSWQWYLNGKKINKPLSDIIVKDGDNIFIKYE